MAVYLERRQFIALLGGTAVTWPLSAHAQQADRVRRIAVLMSIRASDAEAPLRIAAFLQRLQELGWTDRHNTRIDYRLAESNNIQTVAAALVAGAPDVVLVNGTAALQAALKAARSIPIVFVNIIDPVGQGFVASLGRPGGSVTGFSNVEPEMGGQWLKLLKEIAPRVTEVGVLGADTLGGGVEIEAAIQKVAPSFGVKLIPVRRGGPSDAPLSSEVEYAFNVLSRQTTGGLIVLPGAFTQLHRDSILALATRTRLPAIYPYRYYVTSGGLLSYGADTADVFRRAAGYVDRILKGEKPADLPVQQATKFELVINLQTAKMLGLEVPPKLLATADEVIE
jgi:putative tryptophan/tyrosine transport system substrate-binding protein